MRRNSRVQADSPVVKVNLGSGIEVAPGWINIDASLHAVVARLPKRLIGLAYRLSGSRDTYEKHVYLSRVMSNRFVLHDLRYGVPFGDTTVDYLYIGYFLEVLTYEDSQALMHDVSRVMKPGGILRVAAMDFAKYLQRYQEGDKREVVRELLGGSSYTLLNQRRHFYDEETLTKLIIEAGFNEVTRKSFREGSTPDLDKIEKFREPMLVVEASKS